MMNHRPEILQALSSIRHRLLSPALVIDLDAVEHNIHQFISRAGGPHRWRPHIKTNKQSIVIRSLLDHGIRHFKCATVDELELVHAAILSWRTQCSNSESCEIMLAYPPTEAICLWLSNHHKFNLSADQDPQTTIQLLADSPAHLVSLCKLLEVQHLLSSFPIFLDVDVGMNRTGTPSSIWIEAINPQTIPPNLRIAGIHGYEGHIAWHEKEKAQVGYQQLCSLADHLENYVATPKTSLQIVSSGTHSYHHALAYSEFQAGSRNHQVSPGTIIFSDLRSENAAIDLDLRQAAFVISRVVSIGPHRITLDAGSKAISPDCPKQCCRIASHPSLAVKQVSEEHLTIEISDTEFKYGDLLALIPTHVCTTVNMYREALWIREERIIGSGPICSKHSIWATQDRLPHIDD